MTKRRLANGLDDVLSQTFTEKLAMSLMDEKDNAMLERGAANDIVRLRWRLKTRENIIDRLVDEIERLRLTDEERAAVERAIDALSGVEDWSVDVVAKDRQAAATVRELLARLP